MNTISNNNKNLIEAILPLLQKGEIVELTPQGTSMYPLLATPNDRIHLKGLSSRDCKVGEIYLYRRITGQLVVHRLAKKHHNSLYFVGDNQTQLEGPIYKEQVYAVVCAIYRKNKYISCNNIFYRFLSKNWLLLRPCRKKISVPLGTIYRHIKSNRKDEPYV